MDITKTLLELTVSGGEWVLWLLIGISLVSVAIIIERAAFFWWVAKRKSDVTQDVMALLAENKLMEAVDLLTHKTSVESRVLYAGLKQLDKGIDYADDVMECEMLSARKQLNKGLVFLGTMGNNAPFIGLFGTVLGIVKAFKDLSIDTTGGASVVMSGISEALVATAVGLFVAIPAVLANNFFQKVIRNIMIDSQTSKKSVLAQVKHLGLGIIK